MTNPNITSLCFVADSSSSMYTIAGAMNSAIQQVLDEQVELPGELHVDVYRFADEVTHLYRDAHADDVKGEIIVPSGNTALNDAVAMGIRDLGKRFADLPEDERPGKVIFAIVTDGQENKSVEFARHLRGTERVKEMIEKQKNEFSWEFLFFGAESIDAFAVAGDYGIGHAQTMSFAASSTGVGATARAASGYVTRSRLADENTVVEFTQAERDAAEDKTA